MDREAQERARGRDHPGQDERVGGAVARLVQKRPQK